MESASARRTRALLSSVRSRRRHPVLLDVATARFVGNGHVEGVGAKYGRVLAADHGRCGGRHQPNSESPLTRYRVNLRQSSSTILSSPAHPLFSQSVNRRASRVCYGLWSPPTTARALADASPAAMHAYLGIRERYNLKSPAFMCAPAVDFLGAPGTESVLLRRSHGLGTYRNLVFAGVRVVGAVLYGYTVPTRFW